MPILQDQFPANQCSQSHKNHLLLLEQAEYDQDPYNRVRSIYRSGSHKPKWMLSSTLQVTTAKRVVAAVTSVNAQLLSHSRMVQVERSVQEQLWGVCPVDGLMLRGKRTLSVWLNSWHTSHFLELLIHLLESVLHKKEVGVKQRGLSHCIITVQRHLEYGNCNGIL